MAKQKDPFDEIVDELVVFKHEDESLPNEQRYFSNNPMWNDSRVRDAWIARYAEGAQVEEDDDEVIEDDPDDDYETWTNDELRAELAKRQLSVDGKKVDLVGRLREDDEKTEPTQ